MRGLFPIAFLHVVLRQNHLSQIPLDCSQQGPEPIHGGRVGGLGLTLCPQGMGPYQGRRDEDWWDSPDASMQAHAYVIC